MASAKRGRPFEHHDRNQQNKRHRPNQPVYHSATYRDHARPQQQHGNYGQPRDTGHVQQPQLSATDMQTGLVALLDRFVAAETTTDADRDVLHHAQQLRRLLCARNHATSANAKRELDVKRPDGAANVAVPEYIERKVFDAKDLPPLPPIVEPHLHEAVFTHRSANLHPGNSHQALRLDLDYERLELLGDAYIELIASRALYNRFPHVDVPELCSWRERLVENSALGKFSEAYGFPDRLKHRSQWDHSTKAWPKVVADIFEAYVAALVLSDPVNGFSTAEEWLTDLWAPQLLGFRERIIENPQAKEELNKMIVVKDVKLDYRQEKPMTYDSGSIQRFFIGIYLTGWGYENEWLGSGEGQNKHQAAVAAASAAIKNSPAVKVAAQQKGKLMEVRKRALEEARAKEEAGIEEQDLASAQKVASDLSSSMKSAPKTPNTDDASEKRKSGADEPSTTPKKKKHKKEKKDKKDKKDEQNTEMKGANVLN